MTLPNPRAAINWSAAAVLLTAALAVAGVVGWISPLRNVPDDIKAMQVKANENTLKTEVGITKLEGRITNLDSTLTNLNKTVADLSDSIKDVRALRSEFNSFRDQTKDDLARLKVSR